MREASFTILDVSSPSEVFVVTREKQGGRRGGFNALYSVVAVDTYVTHGQSHMILLGDNVACCGSSIGRNEALTVASLADPARPVATARVIDGDPFAIPGEAE